MANDESNPAIPAWQRMQKQSHSSATSKNEAQSSGTAVPPPSQDTEPKEVAIPTPAEPAAVAAAEELGADDTSLALQLQHMQTFLEDPAVKDAPLEKKRAFFLSKGISKEQIDQALRQETQSTLSADDFKSFQKTQPTTPTLTEPQTSVQSPQQRQQSTSPPIITYPEFLVEAHKPPPLITPARILNTAYIASGLAALLYGASTFLITPMSDSLTAARHEFAEHSLSKVDEINTRLSTLVSKIPVSATKPDKPATTDDDENSETASSASSPTELFHRDTGTQTSPPSSRRTSLSPSSSTDDASSKPDPASRASTALSILSSHLTTLVQQTDSVKSANEHRKESLEKLKDYLDSLMFAGTGQGMWTAGAAGNPLEASAEGDVVEGFKREIRGVKGVLLSAKRFPGVGGRTGVAWG